MNLSTFLGTLVGITNMLASIPGFVGPVFVGWMTNNNVGMIRLLYFYGFRHGLFIL